MRDGQIRWKGLALGLGLTGGVASGFANTGCIFKDECIVIISNGNDWCSDLVGALMWPAGHPEFAEVVKDDDEWPRGCACYNNSEEEILLAQVPEVKYGEFVDQILSAARDECDSSVPFGWDHNCYDEGPDGPVLTIPGYDNAGECVGDCSYVNVPKSGCGEDPSPYECEALYGGGDETGGSDEASDSGLDFPREVQWTR